MTEQKEGMTYAGTGVDYGAMDPFKIECLQAALLTSGNATRLGCGVLDWSRGESCIIIRIETDLHLAFVVEGLGTKSKVAKAMAEVARTVEGLSGKSFYRNIAICNFAMAINDLITSGGEVLVYNQYLAVGDSSWFNDAARRQGVIEGTLAACNEAQCVWGGGETPTNKGVIVSDEIDLAGASVGLIRGGRRPINPENIREGDAIVIIESSGIHANGLTLARSIADKLPDGYLTPLSDGRTYGETLLDPTRIYAKLVADCLADSVDIHYLVNVTGHGWRKLMRAPQSWTYVIERLPRSLPIFDFLQEQGPVDDREAYGNLNMNAGFVFYVPEADVRKVILNARDLGFPAIRAGHIEAGPKRVIIKPKDIVFESETLAVR